MRTFANTVGRAAALASIFLLTTCGGSPPKPTPDFSLAVSPGSLSLNAGTTSSAITTTSSALNSFVRTVAVTISGLPSGVSANPSTLTLTPAQPSATTTLTAAITTASAAPTVTFTGTSSSLTHSATLALTLQAAAMTNAPDVTTWHYDLARDGLNSQETILTTSNVNSTQFGKLGFDTVDGKVDASPSTSPASSRGAPTTSFTSRPRTTASTRSTLTPERLWQVSCSGRREAPTIRCTQVTPEIGITSTPVIDRKTGANGTIFVVGMSKDSRGNYHQRLHALDITTGAELTASPTEIAATYPGTGDNSQTAMSSSIPRSTPSAPHCCCSTAPSTSAGPRTATRALHRLDHRLQRVDAGSRPPSSTSRPTARRLHLDSGAGLAADSAAIIYFLDANGTFDTNLDTQRLPSRRTTATPSSSSPLPAASSPSPITSSPSTRISESNADHDLGSGGAILLPDQTDASGTVHHLMSARARTRTSTSSTATTWASSTPPQQRHLSGSHRRALDGRGSQSRLLQRRPLLRRRRRRCKAFPITNAKLATAASSADRRISSGTRATPTVSANGNSNGIVWASRQHSSAACSTPTTPPTSPTSSTTATRLPRAATASATATSSSRPLIVNGKVYVGTQSGVAVFGLLAH